MTLYEVFNLELLPGPMDHNSQIRVHLSSIMNSGAFIIYKMIIISYFSKSCIFSSFNIPCAICKLRAKRSHHKWIQRPCKPMKWHPRYISWNFEARAHSQRTKFCKALSKSKSVILNPLSTLVSRFDDSPDRKFGKLSWKSNFWYWKNGKINFVVK